MEKNMKNNFHILAAILFHMILLYASQYRLERIAICRELIRSNAKISLIPSF